jgi:hypothetical protein
MKRPAADKTRTDRLRRQAREVLGRDPGIGCFRIFGNWLLDAPNPFDPGDSRRPKPGVLIVLGTILLAAAAAAFFNWR